jgi:hypothetical protein
VQLRQLHSNAVGGLLFSLLSALESTTRCAGTTALAFSFKAGFLATFLLVSGVFDFRVACRVACRVDERTVGIELFFLKKRSTLKKRRKKV